MVSQYTTSNLCDALLGYVMVPVRTLWRKVDSVERSTVNLVMLWVLLVWLR